jgi:hypothetical protein
MSNPWLKKNPFMSIWLTAASRIAGSVRGQATAHVGRQVTAAVTGATRESLKRWSNGTTPALAKAKRRR